MLARGIVVEDRVGRLVGRDRALGGVEEADEFTVTVALHAAPDDRPVEQAEDLAFLVERQHHGVGRRIDIEADNVGKLGRKRRITRPLEGAPPMRLQDAVARCGCRWCARQMRCTERGERPVALAIARPVQWVARRGGPVQVSATT